MSSDEDGTELMAAFQRKGSRKPVPPRKVEPEMIQFQGTELEHSIEAEKDHSQTRSLPSNRRAICVRVNPVINRDEYVYYEPADEVLEILRQYSSRGEMLYEVKLLGDIVQRVSANGKGNPDEVFESGKGTMVVATPL
jgi:hypothetical protein